MRGERGLADTALAAENRHEACSPGKRRRNAPAQLLALTRLLAVAEVDQSAGCPVQRTLPETLGLHLRDVMRIEQAVGGEHVGTLPADLELTQSLRGERHIEGHR